MDAEDIPTGLVIRIQEHEYTKLNADNSIARFDPRGKVTVQNKSRRVAVWDAELELNQENKSTLGTGSLPIGELHPLEEWEREFIAKELDGPILSVSEVIDTCYERAGVNNVLVYDQKMPVEFTITLRNRSGATITDIVVTKTIPPSFKQVEPQNIPIGKMQYDSHTGQAVWEIKRLEPERVAILHVRATHTADDSLSIPAGGVRVTYRIPDLSRSRLMPTLHGVSECEVNVEKAEDATRSGIWHCTARLKNTSDFPIRLERVQIVMTAPHYKIFYEGRPNQKLEPQEVWAYEFDTAENNPEFDIIALSTVEAALVQGLVGAVEKEEWVLPVLRVDCSKSLSPSELPAWEPSTVAVSLQAKNVGTATINEVTFFDTIPAEFDAPEVSQVRVRVGDKPITQKIKVTVRPKKKDGTTNRVVAIQIFDLIERHRGIDPGQGITVNYTTIVRAPKPEQEHILPVEVEANTFPPGPVACAKISEYTAPKIFVQTALRKLRKTRTITPGPQKGEFMVTVIFVNVSNSSITDPKLQDVIPPGFEFVTVPDGIPEPTTTLIENGTLISWALPAMMSKERFMVKYIYRHKSADDGIR